MTIRFPSISVGPGKRVVPPKEIRLHFQVAKLLRTWCNPTWNWTHFPSGEKRSAQTGTKLKQMGLQRGWPDFQFISPEGNFYGLELKREGGKGLNDGQEDFQLWCIAHGVPYVVAWTMDDVLTALEVWGCLTVDFKRFHT